MQLRVVDSRPAADHAHLDGEPSSCEVDVGGNTAVLLVAVLRKHPICLRHPCLRGRDLHVLQSVVHDGDDVGLEKDVRRFVDGAASDHDLGQGPYSDDVHAASIPFERLAAPDEIARLVAFLASDEAAYITGASVDIHGGELIIA